MKFSCTQENLLQGLQIVGHIPNKNNSLPILNNILLKIENKELRLLSTNLEVAVSVAVRAKVETEGEITIPARLLLDYISVCPLGRMDVELIGSDLEIKTQNDTTVIKGISSQDFPIIPPLDQEVHFAVHMSQLKESLQKTIFAVSKNESRPELCGVFFNFNNNQNAQLIIAATDSFRLAEKKIPLLAQWGEKKYSVEERKVVAPIRGLQELMRIIGLFHEEDVGETPVEILIQENQIVFRYGSVEIHSRLVDGIYPDYTQIIPSQFKTTATFQVSEWIMHIKAASLFSNTGVQGASFEFFSGNEQKTIITSISSQVGQHTASILTKIEGENNKIVLNCKYLLDGLSNMMSEDVILQMVSLDSPCVVQSVKQHDYIYIIMPIRQ